MPWNRAVLKSCWLRTRVGICVLSLAASPNAFGQASKDDRWENPGATPSVASSAEKNGAFTFKAEPKPAAPPAEDQLYPEGALRAAYETEMREMRKAEDSEREEIRARAAYERKKAEAEEQIARHRHQIQQYRLQQERAHETMSTMENELVHLDAQEKAVRAELAKDQQRSRLESSVADGAKADLTATRAKLERSLADLAVTRANTARQINKYQIDAQQFRLQIMQAEAAVSRAENDKVRLESEELRVRTEWASLNAKSRELAAEKRRALAEIDDLNQRLDKARRDFGVAKRESDVLENEVRNLDMKSRMTKAYILNEMRRLEEGIAQAYNSRARSEGEKARLEAEVSKLREELASVKARHEKAVAAAGDASALVMESRLSFETTKANLAREYAALEKTQLENDTRRIQARNLASMAESSDMLNNQTPAKVIRPCPLRRAPAHEGKVEGELKSGSRVYASPGAGGFYKVLNSSGHVLYVDESCLSF